MLFPVYVLYTENSFPTYAINEGYKNPSDPIQQAIVIVESFSSILIIQSKIYNETNFNFEPVPLKDVELKGKRKKQKQVRLFLPKY